MVAIALAGGSLAVGQGCGGRLAGPPEDTANPGPPVVGAQDPWNPAAVQEVEDMDAGDEPRPFVVPGCNANPDPCCQDPDLCKDGGR